jgi:hypothetical protein
MRTAAIGLLFWTTLTFAQVPMSTRYVYGLNRTASFRHHIGSIAFERLNQDRNTQNIYLVTARLTYTLRQPDPKSSNKVIEVAVQKCYDKIENTPIEGFEAGLLVGMTAFGDADLVVPLLGVQTKFECNFLTPFEAGQYFPISKILADHDTWANGEFDLDMKWTYPPPDPPPSSPPASPSASKGASAGPLQNRVSSRPAFFWDATADELVFLEREKLTTVAKVRVSDPNLGGVTIFEARPGSAEAWAYHSGRRMFSIYDTQNRRLASSFTPPTASALDEYSSLRFSPDGQRAFLVYRTGGFNSNSELVEVNATTKQVVRRIPLPVNFGAGDSVMAPHGLTLYLATGASIYAYDLVSNSLGPAMSTAPAIISGTANGRSVLFLHPDGNRIFLVGLSQVSVFDLQARRVVANWPIPSSHTGDPGKSSLSPLGDTLIVAASPRNATSLPAMIHYSTIDGRRIATTTYPVMPVFHQTFHTVR